MISKHTSAAPASRQYCLVMDAKRSAPAVSQMPLRAACVSASPPSQFGNNGHAQCHSRVLHCKRLAAVRRAHAAGLAGTKVVVEKPARRIASCVCRACALPRPSS